MRLMYALIIILKHFVIFKLLIQCLTVSLVEIKSKELYLFRSDMIKHGSSYKVPHSRIFLLYNFMSLYIFIPRYTQTSKQFIIILQTGEFSMYALIITALHFVIFKLLSPCLRVSLAGI